MTLYATMGRQISQKTPPSSSVSPASSRSKTARKLRTSQPSPKKKLTATQPAPSASVLLNHSQETTEEWYRSPRTKKGYANYVKSGKDWLKTWVAEGGLDDDVGNGPEDGQQRLRFADAFDKITAQTPTALRLLTAYKCDHNGLGFSTAEGLWSAFKLYFER
jgi:hypothetical protein